MQKNEEAGRGGTRPCHGTIGTMDNPVLDGSGCDDVSGCLKCSIVLYCIYPFQ